MTDFNFDPNTMTRAYAQRKALTEEENVRPKARPKGIASKPDDGNTDTSSDEPNFYDKMLDKLLGYFSNEDDADKVLSDKAPDRQDTQTSYEDMFGGLSQETLDAVEQAKQKRMGPADRGDVDVVEKEVITEEAKPKPLVDPKDIAPDLQIMEPEGIEDMPPLPKPATDDGGLMSRDTSPEEGETTTDAGLMSKPLTDDDMGLPERPVYRGFEVPKYKVYNNPDEMSELEILARTIEAEAALESYKGKIAVGATIANRASSGSYGKDIRGVILKPAQFSPWNKYTGAAKGKQGKDMMKLRASEDSYKAANDILTGNYDDPTKGATHYVNESIAQGQKWIDIMKGRKKGTVTIGNHLFGNADSNKTYNGKTWIFDRLSETTDQPLVAEPPTIKAIQRIINADADGKFGPASRKKAIKFLKDKGLGVPEDATNKDLMSLVVESN